MELTASWVSDWMLLISLLIFLTASAEPSANFLTSSATTAKPLPASPALAASMAALSARRLAWSAIEVMVSVISPMAWDFSPKPWMTLAVSTTVSVSRVILSTAAWAVLWPFWALSLVWLTAPEVDWALATACLRVTDAFSIASEVWAARSAWMDAPLATLWMAPETSWVEAFISSDELESSWAEEATLSAVVSTWEKIFWRESMSLLKTAPKRPISSEELILSLSALKSPWAIFSAVVTTCSKGRIIWRMSIKQSKMIRTI